MLYSFHKLIIRLMLYVCMWLFVFVDGVVFIMLNGLFMYNLYELYSCLWLVVWLHGLFNAYCFVSCYFTSEEWWEFS